MTAIPEPTRGDWKRFEEIEPLYSTLQELIDDPVVTQDSIITCSDRIYDHQNTQQLIRLLAHFQRENERLTRQRDVLRENIRLFELNWPETVGFSNDLAREHVQNGIGGTTKEFIDALEGEGGAA